MVIALLKLWTRYSNATYLPVPVPVTEDIVLGKCLNQNTQIYKLLAPKESWENSISGPLINSSRFRQDQP